MHLLRGWTSATMLLLFAGCPTASAPPGDQLYLGTVAGNSTSGTVSVVVHNDAEDGVPAVQAKITTMGGGGGAITCSAGIPSSGSCPGGSVACSGTSCCPSDFPYYCPTTNQCYGSVESVASACGDSCETCTGQDESTTGSSGDVILSGTNGDNYITLEGDGWTMNGDISGDTIAGSFEDPQGDSGLFTANDASHGDVTRFCGQFSGDDSGTWNLQVSGTANGAFAGSLASGTLHGSEGGGSISLTFSGDLASGNASGSISGSSVSGTWSTSDGDYAGSWNGSTSACGGGQTTSTMDCCTQTARGLACPIEGC